MSSTISSTIDTQKENAADRLGGVAGAIRRTSDSLKDEEMAGPLPNLADHAADAIERVADLIQSKTIGEVLGDVEGFARREPALFLGAAFALGLLGGRFMRASGRNATRSMETSPIDDYESDLDADEQWGYDTQGAGYAAGSEGSTIEEIGGGTPPLRSAGPTGPAFEASPSTTPGGTLGGDLGGTGSSLSSDGETEARSRVTDPFGTSTGDTQIGLGPMPRKGSEKKP